MSDLISRQAAVDAIRKHEINLPIYAPRETDVFWDDAIDCCVSVLERLPSVEPEIIRCEDCKYAPKCYGDVLMQSRGGGYIYCPVEYCSAAERRTDG